LQVLLSVPKIRRKPFHAIVNRQSVAGYRAPPNARNSCCASRRDEPSPVPPPSVPSVTGSLPLHRCQRRKPYSLQNPQVAPYIVGVWPAGDRATAPGVEGLWAVGGCALATGVASVWTPIGRSLIAGVADVRLATRCFVSGGRHRCPCSGSMPDIIARRRPTRLQQHRLLLRTCSICRFRPATADARAPSAVQAITPCTAPSLSL